MTIPIQNSRPSLLTQTLFGVVVAISLVLGLFFTFVGYMKAVASIPELARHGAWTAHLIAPVGRVIGVSEIACATLLLACPWRSTTRKLWAAGAALLFATQITAAVVHFAYGELQSLPQNAAIMIGCILIVHAALKHQTPTNRLLGEFE